MTTRTLRLRTVARLATVALVMGAIHVVFAKGASALVVGEEVGTVLGQGENLSGSVDTEVPTRRGLLAVGDFGVGLGDLISGHPGQCVKEPTELLRCLDRPEEREDATSRTRTCNWNGHWRMGYWYHTKTGRAFEGTGDFGSYIECNRPMFQLTSYVDVYHSGKKVFSTDNRSGTTEMNTWYQDELGGQWCNECNGTWRVHWNFLLVLPSGDDWVQNPNPTNCELLSQRTLTCHYAGTTRIQPTVSHIIGVVMQWAAWPPSSIRRISRRVSGVPVGR